MRIPKYRLHRASGQAMIEWRCRRYYLGRYGSADSREKYKRFLEERILPLLPVKEEARLIAARGLTVAELCDAYLDHAKQHYGSGEYLTMRLVATRLADEAGAVEVASFGPLRLKEIRQKLERERLRRSYINGQINRMRRIFRWGVANELAPASTIEALKALPGIGKRTKTEALPPKDVSPVAQQEVDALLPYLCRIVRAMVEVQVLTGMRSDELCRLRGDRIARGASPWLYDVGEHKADDTGRSRVVPIGPKAQAILKPFLERPPNQYLFSPAEAVEEYHRARRETRKTKVQPSQTARRKRAKPLRTPGSRYRTKSYYKSILAGFVRMAKSAGHERPAGKTIHQWLRSIGIEPWHPHQLRHTFGTVVRQRYGLEGAQVSLGHSKADVTQIYAERDLGLAIEIAADMG